MSTSTSPFYVNGFLEMAIDLANLTNATGGGVGVDQSPMSSSSAVSSGSPSVVNNVVNNSVVVTHINANNTVDDKSLTDIIKNTTVRNTFFVLYSTIFALGIIGNVLVCYVVLRNRAMQTVTNLFITNLALSDILLCALAVPFTPLYTFLERWIFGTALCHLVPYAQGCSVYISTLTLTSIAIDRFFVIIYPFHPRMKLSTCVLIVIGIWTFSLMVTLPYGLYMTVKQDVGDTVNETIFYCEENWPKEKHRKIFGTVTSSLQFLIPFLVISFCYICVSKRLSDRARAKPGAKTTKKEAADRDRKKRTNRMLIAMVIVFGISWLPINLINIRNDFDATATEWEYTNLLFFIAHFIAMSSTCYNPFLYAWLNDNFRKEFKQVLPCIGGNTSQFCLQTIGKWRASANVERPYNGHTRVQALRLAADNSAAAVQPRELTTTFDPSRLGGSPSRTPVATSTTNTATITTQLSADTTNYGQGTFLLPSGVLETNFEGPTVAVSADNDTDNE